MGNFKRYLFCVSAGTALLAILHASAWATTKELVEELKTEPLSLFDWGLYQLENELQKADELYSRVLAEFADTPFATQANERHEEIGKLASVRTARRNDSN